MTWIESIEGLIAPAMTGVLGVVGALFIRRSAKEQNSTESWKALFEGHQQWTRDQLEEQDLWTKARLAERDEKIAALEKDVHELSARFAVLDEKYRAALAYIRELWHTLSLLLRHEDIPAVPEKISPDL